MNTQQYPKRSPAPGAAHNAAISRPDLWDRADLSGLECGEASWEDWDASVAEQDLRLLLQAGSGAPAH